MQTHFFHRFFVEKAPPGSQKVLKKCPRGVPGATRRLSGRLFWGQVAGLNWIPLATPPKNISPWRPRVAPRCPKAPQDAISGRKLEEKATFTKPKNKKNEQNFVKNQNEAKQEASNKTPHNDKRSATRKAHISDSIRR